MIEIYPIGSFFISILHQLCYTREKGGRMKKILNKKIIGLSCLVFVFAAFFLVKAYANKAYGYEIRMDIKMSKGEEKSLILPSKRQVAYWKIEEGKMGPWDVMRLAKDCDSMSLGEISKKLGQEPKYSDKSKIIYDGKAYDKMTSAMYEKNKGKIKEEIKIRNLKEGAYLIKETDESFKQSKAREKLTTRIEYVGKESAPEGVLELEDN